ncbi:MAG TPA: hypothetical protein VGM11_14295, partial [Acidobacteriaceae bacterium]
PGARESRWMHLLAGNVEAAVQVSESAGAGTEGRQQLAERVAELERTVFELRERVAALEAERGKASGGEWGE